MATGQDRRLRARDIDRAVVATALDTAYADGQLTFDEHRSRVAAARTATTLGDLHALAADLQADVPLPEAVRPAPGPSRRPVIVGLLVVVLVLGVAVVLAVRGSDAPSSPSVTAPSSSVGPGATAAGTATPIVARPFVFDTPEGLADFRDRWITRFGDPEVTELVLYPSDDRASLTRLAESDRVRDVSVRGGFEESTATSPRETDELPFDLTVLDVAALAGLMAGSASFVEVPDASVTHVIVRNEGVPEVLVYAADADGRGGYLQATLAGEVTRVSPHRP
ncbi:MULTISPECIES: DUF1707 domain-containing protein [unclassified Rhodococcus (in: high G+C Gram-positive bacteria)]|uniref:DUF1707 SHOCT-like domain-containing protein n=1 Tax=unclassified Rhodococcus (in: high G+C Gram-positive bacteria) TaxID=192944 RepID=UPI0006F50D40|nr:MULTISPECIES: DUF1707 domain-containing protein [unclassified Rhodococcus (in: high G+C Gram-positive bacteria)]KQU35915.1 hypothetical protein ASG69_16265 [Rhodococcus sp. Leaf225]KQU48462.1 hypothetical protein ASH03_00740 [Rhodococcus sp. Leaf258]